jgi:hypothetical protein
MGGFEPRTNEKNIVPMRGTARDEEMAQKELLTVVLSVSYRWYRRIDLC